MSMKCLRNQQSYADNKIRLGKIACYWEHSFFSSLKTGPQKQNFVFLKIALFILRSVVIGCNKIQNITKLKKTINTEGAS